MKIEKTLLWGLALIAVLGFIAYATLKAPARPFGSVTQGNEYNATSTAASVIYGATVTDDKLIKTGAGSLAQITITGANTGVVNFYDATTSNVLLRTGQKATSTILITSLPASLVAGTYTFDAAYGFGLLLELEAGLMPTTTITYR